MRSRGKKRVYVYYLLHDIRNVFRSTRVLEDFCFEFLLHVID